MGKILGKIETAGFRIGQPKAGKAIWAMSHIKKLYRIEAFIKD